MEKSTCKFQGPGSRVAHHTSAYISAVKLVMWPLTAREPCKCTPRWAAIFSDSGRRGGGMLVENQQILLHHLC